MKLAVVAHAGKTLGDRTKVRSFEVDIEPSAITVCVQRAAREKAKQNVG